MQIDVTEKEAMDIYTQRYLANRGKVRYLPLLILAIAIFVSMFIYSTERQWLSVIILIVIAAPAIYLSLRSARASGKYAKSQIEDMK